MIFIVSVFTSLTLLLIERLVGIDWDFHVDSVTYIESMEFYDIFKIYSFLSLSNNLHYFVVSFLGGIEGTIAYNIVLTALGNQIIYTKILKEIKGSTRLILLLYLFNPYKMHLSVTLLKDSAIIFFLIIGLFTRYQIIGILLGGFYRNAFIFYLVLHKAIRKWYILFFLLVIVLYFFATGFNSEKFGDQIGNNMTFRDFDLVPNFTQYGAILGAIIRVIVWPFLTITGLFFIISPTVAYFPLFIGSLSLMIVLYKLKIRLSSLVPTLMILSFFSVIVPGFTTFFRYVFPLIALLPYILIFNKINEKY